MYVETFIGPFSSNITVSGNISHIGVEQPHSTPITFSIYREESASFDKMSDFEINGENFYLNAGDILEFGDNNYSQITISPLFPNNEYTIITVGYESKGE